jgi:adenosylmethionine-8-amino-7-oxononanoate aminotransferase
LGCAAAIASLDVFEADRTLEVLGPKIERLGAHLKRISEHRHVGDVRHCGLIAGVEIVRDKATREAYPYAAQVGAKICAAARRYGVILRPLADVIVVMPPLMISMESLDRMMEAVERGLNEVISGVQAGGVDGLE